MPSSSSRASDRNHLPRVHQKNESKSLRNKDESPDVQLTTASRDFYLSTLHASAVEKRLNSICGPDTRNPRSCANCKRGKMYQPPRSSGESNPFGCETLSVIRVFMSVLLHFTFDHGKQARKFSLFALVSSLTWLLSTGLPFYAFSVNPHDISPGPFRCRRGVSDCC